MISNTPTPPYYAVIFSSVRTTDTKGYTEMNALMNALAVEQQGFLGMENAQSDIGISISYWSDLEAIKRWKDHLEHQNAQKEGQNRWYQPIKCGLPKLNVPMNF